MAEKTNPVPPGFHTLTPHLTVCDADKALSSTRMRLEPRFWVLRACLMERSCTPHCALAIPC